MQTHKMEFQPSHFPIQHLLSFTHFCFKRHPTSFRIPIVQEAKAIERGVLPVLRRATLVQTFGQKHHVCLKEGSITIPPYTPPHKMRTHFVPPETPRSIFVYFRGLFYDTSNDPEGGYYARYAPKIELCY
jgi:hypothetical protein